MLIVLSPAKSLDYTPQVTTAVHTRPECMSRSATLIDLLRNVSPAALATLMKISDPLAQLNAQRYQDWSTRVTSKNAKQAVLAFNGDVYDGLQARTMDGVQLAYLQSHLRILSGLYGVLRPLDLMQPHRLEMGTRLENEAGRDLYAFWGDSVTSMLQCALAAHSGQTLINLASEEYFKAVRPALLDATVISPVFEDWKNGQYKIISFFAKRARGAMTRYAALHAITDAQQLQDFNTDGYCYDAAASSASRWHFRRRIAG